MLSQLILIIFKYLFMAIGRVIMRLIYGKEGWKSAETLNKVNDSIALLLTIGFISWVSSIGVLIESGSKSLVAILWVIVFPIIITLWGVYTKKNIVPALIEEAKPILTHIDEIEKRHTNEANQQIIANEAAKANGWTCTCGRTHAAYESTCVCGTKKQEVKLKSMQNEQ